MKNIKQIREEYDLITEKEEKETKKLSALVRAGLYDAKKLPALKKALDKTPDKMTGQEKRMLVNLLDSLISQVTSDEQVYRKVRQNVQHVNESKKDDTYSKFDSRVNQGYPSDKDIPAVLILKRKAIRVYPDNQKVALYYSQAIDKYVTIPFSDIQTGINEEEQIEENIIAGGLALARVAGPAIARGIGSALRSPVSKRIAGGISSAATKAKNWGKRALSSRRNRSRRNGQDIDFSMSGGNNDPTVTTGNQPSKSELTKYNFTAKPNIHSGESHINRGDTPAEKEKADRLSRQSLQSNLRKESVLRELKNMIDNDIIEQTMVINEQQININNTVAKKIMLVYESVNNTNKKKMEKMLNESAASFNKVLTFALRQ